MTYVSQSPTCAAKQPDQGAKSNSLAVVDSRTSTLMISQLQSLMAASPAQEKLGAAAQLMADKKINSSAAPLQRIEILGNPSYAPRPQQRSGEASINLKLDGKLDPENDPAGRDSLTLSAEGMQPMMKGRKGVLTAMHLINARLGGSGVEVANLAWGSQGHNSAHLSEIEKAAKDEAEDVANIGNRMEYKTIPEYCSDTVGDPSFYFLKNVTSSYKVQDSSNTVISEDSKTVGSDGMAEVQDNDFIEKIRGNLPPRAASTRVRHQSRQAIDSAASQNYRLGMSDVEFDKMRRDQEMWKMAQKERKRQEKAKSKGAKMRGKSGRISKKSSDKKNNKKHNRIIKS